MTRKKYRSWLAVLVILLFLPMLPVQAASPDYRIDITDDAASSLQELDITEHSISQGDMASHQIYVDNHTTNGHVVQLKNIEVVKDSILLNKLNFEFINGSTVVPFTKGTMTQAYNKALFQVGNKGTGDFTLKMTVNGDLNNSYQGTSCTLRYTFEIINLNQDGGSSTPPSSSSSKPSGSQPQPSGGSGTTPSGQQDQQNPGGDTLPTTLGAAMKTLLPTTGEGKALVTSILGLILFLSLFLIIKNRKKDDAAPEKEPDA